MVVAMFRLLNKWSQTLSANDVSAMYLSEFTFHHQGLDF